MRLPTVSVEIRILTNSATNNLLQRRSTEIASRKCLRRWPDGQNDLVELELAINNYGFWCSLKNFTIRGGASDGNL